MRPWLVVAAQVEVIPLMIVCGVLQVLPALAEEVNPTLSCVLPADRSSRSGPAAPWRPTWPY